MTDIKKVLRGSTSLGGFSGAIADDGDVNTEISDSDKKIAAIADMIADACAKMDSVGNRMDAMEENFRRMDAAEKEKGEPEEVAADNARKDAEEKEAEEAARKDAEEKEEAARKDAEEKEKEEAAKADSAAATRAELAEMRATIAAMSARTPSIINDADRERFAMIQEQADPAFQAFNDRAPAPLDGETPIQYKRRLGKKLQVNSAKWKTANLTSISDDAMLDTVIADIYADSINAARAGVDVPAGQLRTISKRLESGHIRNDFVGTPEAWMRGFSGRSQRAGTRRTA